MHASGRDLQVKLYEKLHLNWLIKYKALLTIYCNKDRELAYIVNVTQEMVINFKACISLFMCSVYFPR